MTGHPRPRYLVGGLVLALFAAGCSSSPALNKTRLPGPIENPTGTTSTSLGGNNARATVPAATGALPAAGPCTVTCATGDDGMQYRVTSARRFTGPGGVSVVAVGFSMTDSTDVGHDFDASGGGFSAVLASGGVVQLENQLNATTAGDPTCYTNPVINGGGTDPNLVHVDPHATFVFPKQICMSVAASDRVTEIEFADQDAGNNATVTLPTPI